MTAQPAATRAGQTPRRAPLRVAHGHASHIAGVIVSRAPRLVTKAAGAHDPDLNPACEIFAAVAVRSLPGVTIGCPGSAVLRQPGE